MRQEEDVLDTWFSSALWPHSTLGWPEPTAELAYYYPTSTLITSRDIITLWVARMVLAGLNNTGDVPFHEVFIHPKILDGYGETMSKSKGNGVDPVDVIEKFGADALRFGLALLCTETQDARLPVQFECPHCAALIEQTKENRELSRIVCSQCGRPFSTQWAGKAEDKALPRGPVVSERFELARNFCNKLWNVSRLVLMKLDGYSAGSVREEELAFEDRWILSRLASITQEATNALDAYRYADAARMLCDFAWNEFCSFYAEMLKGRLEEAVTRATAQRVAAHVLDQLLRLLHPLIPFLTEEIWQLLGQSAPRRGLPRPELASSSIVVAAWPEADLSRQDARLEARFAQFQAVLGAIREIRSNQQIPPRQNIEFSVRCDEATARLLEPMRPYFRAMANARDVAWGSTIQPPPTHAKRDVLGAEVFVDLKDAIDVEAEILRNEKQAEKLRKMIAAKQQKLANENFVQRAPENVVQGERDSLAQLQEQLESVEAILAQLDRP
jgi:valyl-tRNA synthetase